MSSPSYQSQTSQHFSLVNHLDLDDEFEPLFDDALSQAVGAPALIGQFVDKWKNTASCIFSTRKEFSYKYLIIKEKQLEWEEHAHEIREIEACIIQGIGKT
ncbi:hypothetical protein Tco_0792306 [Tanacetum coccineum]